MPLAVAAAGVKTLPDVSISHSLIQMVLALLVIVAAIWGLGKILARMRGATSTPKRRAATNGLSIISRQSLGKDLAIATVRWGEREVLVGIAGSTITFLNDARPEANELRAPDHAPAGYAMPAMGSPVPGMGSTPMASAPTSDPFAALRTAGMADAGRASAPETSRPFSFADAMRTREPAGDAERSGSIINALRNATLRR